MNRSSRLILVASGSALGAGVRWFATESSVNFSDRWVLFMLNVVGSVLLGAILGWAANKHQSVRLAASRTIERVVLGVGTGFCGGLTSFSTFVVDIAQLLRSGIYVAALTTTFATVVVATVFAAAGYRLGKARS